MDEPADPFHKHLDTCAQCREQPFNLCTDGVAAMDESMKKLEEELSKTAPLPPYLRRFPRWP